MYFPSNLKILRKIKKQTQREFGELLEAKDTTISNWEQGISNPDIDTLMKISSIFGISIDDLIKVDLGSFEEVEIYNYIYSTYNSNQEAIANKKVPVISKPKSSIISSIGIPYFEFSPVSAGDFISFLNQAKPTSFIDLPQLTGCEAVLPVYGSSMKGVVEPGDLIAIKEVKSRNEFDPALPYLVITDEHRMIKYLRMDEEDHSIIWAESTNHSRIKLSTDIIKMVYAIKCVIRFF